MEPRFWKPAIIAKLGLNEWIEFGSMF